ncbi:heterokaryon incompatibility protein [Hyaloscypha sp. PMI_1271]|nr:heterokaryon incompatibility protein [Hyaloscypha sp. PMI_1271]
MPSSLLDEARGVIQTHTGSSDNIRYSGPGIMNINKAVGDFYQSHNTGPVSFGNIQSQWHLSDPQTQNCLLDLQTTDPRKDKKRIEDTKEGQVLWIKGDPGKGKTMLLCGIIDEMSALRRLRDKNATTLLSFFFYQATDSRINNAAAVLRGLIYLLIDQQLLLIKHIRKKYNHAGKALFEDINAWVILSEIFTNLPKLLDFIIVSSRNWPDIKERLERAGHKVRLCLELNAESISTAIRKYIGHKVHQLAQLKKYDNKTRVAVL